MLNSRDISLLRPDVAYNCLKWIELCTENGLNVLVTNTVRDAEYQRYLYEQGRTREGSIVTNSKTPTFHATTAGLAFDFCKNVKGHEYDDAEFFKRAGEIANKIGFSWGGDWKTFPDAPHIQWDYGGKYNSTMILSGQLPPKMPKWSEESEEIEMRYETVDQCPTWAKDTVQKLIDHGYLSGDGESLNLSVDMLRTFVVLDRAKLFDD